MEESSGSVMATSLGLTNPDSTSSLATASLGTSGKGPTSTFCSLPHLDRDATRLTEFGFRKSTPAKQRGLFDRLIGSIKGEDPANANSPGGGKPEQFHESQLASNDSTNASPADSPAFNPLTSPTSPPAMQSSPTPPMPQTVGRQYWMSDKTCSVCYDCTLPFHFWRRRHHCRLCGQIFCNACSEQTVDGRRYNLSQGQVRVCKQCFKLDQGYVSAQTTSGVSNNPTAVAGGGVIAAAIGVAATTTPRDALQRQSSSGRMEVGVGTPMGHGRSLSVAVLATSPQVSSSLLSNKVGAFDGLSLLSEGNLSQAASVGGFASSYMDSNPPIKLNEGSAFDNLEDEDMQIPTGTTPSTKYRKKKRQGSTFASSNVDAEKDAEKISPQKVAGTPANADASLPVVDELDEPKHVIGAPPESGSSALVEADGEEDDDDDEEEEVVEGGDESEDYGEEDDEFAANHAPLDGQDAPANGTANGSAAAVSAQDADLRDDDEATVVTPSIPIPAASVSSPSTIHTMQLAAQLSEIQLMQIHRNRIAKVNRHQLIYVVAHLVKSYEIDARWMNVLLQFADRCTAHVQTEPNRRMRFAMYNQQQLMMGQPPISYPPVTDDHMDLTPYVKIKTIGGGTIRECKMIDGVMFRKNVAHKKMSTLLRGARVLLLNCALEYQRIENRLSSLDAVLEQEKAYIQIQISKILSWRPDIVVVEKSVSRLAQDLLREANVTLVLNVQPSLMARLARAIQAQPIVPATDYVDKCASIGTCGKFAVETYTTALSDAGATVNTPPSNSAPVIPTVPAGPLLRVFDPNSPSTSSVSPPAPSAASSATNPSAAAPARVIVMAFSECNSNSHATILLRGETDLTLKRIKLVLKMCIQVAYHLSLETALMFDQCATYSNEQLEKLQNNYYHKVAQLWGKTSDIALMLLSKSAKLKLQQELSQPAPQQLQQPVVLQPFASRAHVDEASVLNSTSPPPVAPTPPPLPSTPAPIRPGFGLPLSSSPFVDMSIVPIPQAVLDLRKHFDDNTSHPPSPPLWVHDCILFGSTWFSSAFQCFAPECKGIQFYADTDKTLAQFLFENCFDLKLRCLNEKCGKDVLKHILAYTHNEGRIVITVKRIRKRQNANTLLFSPNGPIAQHARTLSSLVSHAQGFLEQAAHNVGIGKNEGNLGENSIDATGVPSSTARHPLDHPSDIMMWNRCKLCARRVTPYMPMSDPTYKMSFGKFLDLTFHQRSAICRTGGCSHVIHSNHIRFFGYAGLMASFEYEPFPSYQIVTVPRLLTPAHQDVALLGKYHSDLRQLSTLSYIVFEEFIVRIAEVDGLLDLQEQRDQLRKLTRKVCLERDRFTTYMQQIGIGPQNKYQRGDSAAEPVSESAPPLTNFADDNFAGSTTDSTGAVGTDSSLYTAATSVVTASVLFDGMDIYRLQRRLLMNFFSWNQKLSDLSQLFFSKRHGNSMSTTSNKSWWSLGGNSQQAENESRRVSHSDTSNNTNEPTTDPSPRESIDSNPLEIRVDGHEGSTTHAADRSMSAADSSEPSNHNLNTGTIFLTPSPSFNHPTVPNPSPNGTSSKLEKSGEKKPEFSFRDFFRSMADLSSKPTAASPSLQVTVDSLLNHNPLLSPETFDLLKHPPHLGVPPSVPPLCVPVHDDQPSSIIAYTLASLEHLLTVGRIRPTEMKSIQAVQSWMAQEEEHAVNSLEHLKHPSHGNSDTMGLGAHAAAAAAASQTPSPAPVARSTTQVPFEAPTLRTSPTSTSDLSSASDRQSSPEEPSLSAASSVSATPQPPTSNSQPLPPASTLHHSYSDHHVSFLYPNSLQTHLPNHAPPQLPYHLTCPALLGYDPIRDRLDIIETAMTKFVTGEFANQSNSSSSGPSSSASTDYGAQSFKYTFEDVPSADFAQHESSTVSGESMGSSASTGAGHPPSNSSASMSNANNDVDRTIFRCTAYYPRQFHALRLVTCGGDYSFIQSLCHCNKWSVTGGKSGSTFLKTSDERFILKFITRTELKMFLESASKYFSYMAKNLFHNLPSFLVKILGVYQLSWKKHSSSHNKKNANPSASDTQSLSSQYVLVMPNLFYSHSQSISKIFDLKGSARNRYVKKKNRDENRVLLDENLMEYTDGYPLPLNDSSKNVLRMAVFNDTLFLSNLEVVDYSIIVGLEKKTQKLVVGIIDYVRQYTWDKFLETSVKSVGRIAGQGAPTVISPPQYKLRFRNAMERYFMHSPNMSSKLSLLTTPNINDPNEKDSKAQDK